MRISELDDIEKEVLLGGVDELEYPVVIDLQNMNTEEHDRYTRAELRRRFAASERLRAAQLREINSDD